MTTLPPRPEMVRATLDRDASYTGVFYFGVKTTGVFCLPGCRARSPHEQNIEFFVNAEQATAAGFRACKVCRPTSAPGGPTWFDALIAEIEANPARRISDADLRARSIDPVATRRLAQRRFGVTFHGYQRALGMGRALATLQNDGSVLDAGFDAGFSSASGFRAAFADLFEATPGQARDRGSLTFAWLHSPLGPMVAVASDRGITLLEFVDRPSLRRELRVMRQRFDAPLTPGTNVYLQTLAQQLEQYFAGTRRAFDVALDLGGTEFQRRVWSCLLSIPYGETSTYQAIARELDKPGAARAVGSANGHNQIAIVIPCHRVIRADRSLSGYGGGVWRKRRLLDLEQAQQCLVEEVAQDR